MAGWIDTKDDLAMPLDRIRNAISTAEAQRIEADRVDRAHRDLQTACRLEIAIRKVPAQLL